MTLRTYRKARNRRGETQATVDANRVAVEPAERQVQRAKARRRSAFCALFTKVDSIIAGRDVSVRLATDNWTHNQDGNSKPVAWTDGETIWVSRGRFDNLMFPSGDQTSNLKSIDALSALKGLNYHELAHVLFTPRNGHKPLPQVKALQKSCDEGGGWEVTTTEGNTSWIRAHDIWHSFNVLEDQRIETLFTAKWTASVPYFLTAITEFILKDMQGRDGFSDEGRKLSALVHLLTHGRQYLPASVRSDLRLVCAGLLGETEVAAVDALIDEYRLLVFPKGAKRAVEIIKEFTIWLARHTGGAGPTGLPNPSGGHEHIRDGKADAAIDQRVIRDRAEETSSQTFDDVDDVDEADQKGSGDTTDSDAGSAQDGEGNHGKPDDDGISDTDDGSDDQSDSGSSSGTGQDAPKHPDHDEIIDSLNDLLRDSKDDVLTDVIDTIKTMRDYEDEIISRESQGTHAAKTFTSPSHLETQTRQRLSQSLSQLRSDAEPQWVKRVSSGRINVPAVMAGRGVDLDIFDSWTDAGDDASSIEVVILLDQSGSMQGQMASVSGAMWVIKGACDDLEIPCTVIGYSDKHATLLGRNDLVGANSVGRFPTIGGTDPRGALEEAHRIFAGSDRRHKLLFSVTDGEWFSGNTAAQLVREIGNLGVHTDLIYLTHRTDTDGLDHLRDWMEARKWNGHKLGAIATSLPAMVRHIDKALAGVMLDVIADAV